MKEKSKGGRGKAEIKRNMAMTILNNFDHKMFSYYWLGQVFGRDPKTVSDVIKETKKNIGGLSTGNHLAR